jgi:hypothetical protein
MATKRKRAPKEKVQQGHLEGLEPPRIKAIDDAADTYYEVMMERCKLSKEEYEAQTALLEVMMKENLTRYVYDGKVVTMTSTTKIKVKPNKEEAEVSEA